MRYLILTILLPVVGYADSVTSIETNNTPVSGYSGEAYTDPVTHIHSPSTDGTHIISFNGTGITATQTPNFGGSGLSQVTVNLNGLQTTQSIANAATDVSLQNQITHISLTPGPIGPQGAQGTAGINGVNGASGIQGVAGATGHAGAQGVQGMQGLQGQQGLQGAPGKDMEAPGIDPRLDVEVREYDAEHWSLASYASFGMQTSTARYIVGEKLTLKIGKSYEQTEIDKLKQQLRSR
jgi:hypothetical protein